MVVGSGALLFATPCSRPAASPLANSLPFGLGRTLMARYGPGGEKNAASLPQPRTTRPREAGVARVMNISRDSPAQLLSASLLPYEIVRIKPRLGRRDTPDAAPCGLIDGSPPVRPVPNQFATGFAAPLDYLEAPLFRGQRECSRRRPPQRFRAPSRAEVFFHLGRPFYLLRHRPR